MHTFLLLAIAVLAWFAVTCFIVAFFAGADKAKVNTPDAAMSAADIAKLEHLANGGSIEGL